MKMSPPTEQRPVFFTGWIPCVAQPLKGVKLLLNIAEKSPSLCSSSFVGEVGKIVTVSIFFRTSCTTNYSNLFIFHRVVFLKMKEGHFLRRRLD